MPTEEKLDPEQRLRAALAASHKIDDDAKAALVEELKARQDKPAEAAEKPVVNEGPAIGVDSDDLAAAQQLKEEQKEAEVQVAAEAPADNAAADASAEVAVVVAEDAKEEAKATEEAPTA